MEDATLASGLKARDGAVIELFWRIYFEKLYPICAYILGDGPDALDATVDLLVDFVENHVYRLTKPESLYSYLRLMAVRRSLRLRERRQKSTEFIDGDHSAVDSGTDDFVWTSQLMPLLDTCLGSITPKAQKALRLKYGNKISNEQIGRQIGGSKQYIGRLLRDALKVLRSCIERNGTSEDSAQPRGAP